MLRSWVGVALVAVSLCGRETRPAAPPSSADERAVVKELMKIRMFPREYAKYLRALGARFDGTLWRLADHVPIRTNEGRSAVLEAAAFLETVEPVMERIAYSEGLHRAAFDHVRDQGPSGQTGHVGQDGSTLLQRIQRHGQRTSTSGEIINYGPETPRMTVIQLVIDDGVADRSHRTCIFNPKLRVAGAAIGFHKQYGTMTVVDLADGFTDPPAGRP